MVKTYKYNGRIKEEYLKNQKKQDKVYITLKIASYSVLLFIVLFAIFSYGKFSKIEYYLAFPIVGGIVSGIFDFLAKHRRSTQLGIPKNAEDSLNISDGETLFYHEATKPKTGEKERYKIYTIKISDIKELKADGNMMHIQGKGKLSHESVMKNGEKKVSKTRDVDHFSFLYTFADRDGFVKLVKKNVSRV